MLDKRSGFTLIELIVVVGISTLVFGGAVAAFRNFDDKQKAQLAGDQVAAELRKAQKRAQSGEKNCSASTLNGWRVTENTDNLQIQEICASGAFGSPVTIDILNGVNISNFGSITFSAISGKASNSPTITARAGSCVYTLSVSNVGGINEQGVICD